MFPIITIFANLGRGRRCGCQTFFDNKSGNGIMNIDTTTSPLTVAVSFQKERADNRIFDLRVIGSASMRLAL